MQDSPPGKVFARDQQINRPDEISFVNPGDKLAAGRWRRRSRGAQDSEKRRRLLRDPD
jgi:hypothetical protein